MDEDRIGVALGESLIVDLHEAAIGLKLPFNFPYTMSELIDFDAVAQETVRFLLYQCERYPHRVKPIPLTEIEWLPPLRRPGKILCINQPTGSNNLTFALKPSSSLIGHNQTIKIPEFYGPIFSEPRLAVVIGKRAGQIKSADAVDHIYGYTLFNNIVGADQNEILINGTDRFGPMGPWLVTRNEVPDLSQLNVSLSLNDKIVSFFQVNDLPHSIGQVIEQISTYQTLEAGDVLCFGMMNEEILSTFNLQKQKGELTVDIPQIGTLTNRL